MSIRSRRAAALACATATVTALLVAVPGTAGSVGVQADGPVIPGWQEAAPDAVDVGKVLAPGIEHFRYQENPVTDPAHPRYGMPRREFSVLRIDPAKGSLRIESSTGKAAGSAEIVRDQLNANTKNLPIAGINGSYFMPEGLRKSDPAGTEESVQSFGATVRDGVLLGAACHGASRSSLVLQHGIPYITTVRTKLALKEKLPEGATATPEEMVLDDVNRNPGVPLACKREEGDGEKVDFVHSAGKKELAAFQDPTELVLFNDQYGLKTPARNLIEDPKITADDDEGFEVLIAADGTLSRPQGWTAQRGGKVVPKGQYVLQAVGKERVDWLKARLASGVKFDVEQTMTDTFGNRPLPLDESVDVVSGGADLFDDGVAQVPSVYVTTTNTDPEKSVELTDPLTGAKVRAALDEAKQPVFSSCARAVKTVGKISCQDSRTVVGVDDQGRTLFATLTGPRDEADEAVFAGGFLVELNAPLTAFGVMDAVNLDGGGSTMMLLRDSDHPQNYQRHTGLTDATHREVFDTVYVGFGGQLLG
ncbi:phosphodiester glycosidase family protein [Streptomyces sp. NPDC097619]|uniref:phosphodiester glycosidase family protein n=1 Tax=Streptomyces sp. NPDC097619 TaxID=3157228 RepID=UPI00332304D6